VGGIEPFDARWESSKITLLKFCPVAKPQNVLRPHKHEHDTLWDKLRKSVSVGDKFGERRQDRRLERVRMFTDRLHEEMNRLDLRVIGVDTTVTEDDVAEEVREAFGL